MDSPLKWHGGKHYLAPKLWEIAKSIPHVHRVEVFGGSLAFTLATEPEGYSEVVSDANGKLMNFWSVLRNPDLFPEFQRRCEATPFSESLYRECGLILEKEIESPAPRWLAIEHAHAFFVFCRQSMAGRMNGFAPLTKRRVRRGMNEQVSAWLTTVEGLPVVHERLKRVVVRHRGFDELIPSEDKESTLFYCDPPYLHETRSTTTEYGKFEMSEKEHMLLLKRLAALKGKFMLSGYRSEMYAQFAESFGWRRIDWDLPNNSASGASKERKTESLWLNF